MHIHSVQPKGSALIVALSIVFFLAALCTVLMNEMLARSTRVQVDQEDLMAFEAAEAGLDAALNDINSGEVAQLYYLDPPTTANPRVTTRQDVATYGEVRAPQSNRLIKVRNPALRPGCLGTETWNAATDDLLPGGTRNPNYIARPSWKTVATSPRGGGAEIFNEPNIIPQQIGDVAFFTYAIDWLNDGLDNDGNGVADDINERNKFTIYSTGIHRGLVKSGRTREGRIVTLQVIAQARDMDVGLVLSAPIELQIGRRD